MIIKNKETTSNNSGENIETNHTDNNVDSLTSNQSDSTDDSQKENITQDDTDNIADTENDTQEYDVKKDFLFELENGLVVTKIANYSGAYMEDGSDDKVDNVLMVLVKNNGKADLVWNIRMHM